jgi:hypothetical protein
MIAMFHGRVQNDDAYNRIRADMGDSTSAAAQVAALRALGLKATFSQRLTVADVAQQIAKRQPLTLNWLHQGHITKPRPGGHVVVCIGTTSTHLWVHDPAGEPDLIGGGHIRGRTGRSVRLTWANFRRRWEMEGPGSGWGLTVDAPIRPRQAA